MYKSNTPISIIGIDKVHLKCECINGSIVNVIRETFLHNFALDKPPGHKICKEPRFQIFRRLNIYVLSHITFYLEDEDHRRVDFNGERIPFTCQLLKIKFYNIIWT